MARLGLEQLISIGVIFNDELIFIQRLPYSALNASKSYVMNISLNLLILMGFGRLAFRGGGCFA